MGPQWLVRNGPRASAAKPSPCDSIAKEPRSAMPWSPRKRKTQRSTKSQKLMQIPRGVCPLPALNLWIRQDWVAFPSIPIKQGASLYHPLFPVLLRNPPPAIISVMISVIISLAIPMGGVASLAPLFQGLKVPLLKAN